MKSTALQTKRKKSNKELEDFHDSQALDGGRRHQTDRTKKSEGQPGGACGCRAQVGARERTTEGLTGERGTETLMVGGVDVADTAWSGEIKGERQCREELGD